MPGLKRSWKLTAADELALVAAGEDAPRRVEVRPHRLLHQHRGAARQLLEDADDLIAGDGDVEDGAGVAPAASASDGEDRVDRELARPSRARCSGSMSKTPATG